MAFQDDEWATRRRAEHYELPGSPPAKLVREVRKTLRSFIRCSPHRDDRVWKMAWEWARSIAIGDSLAGIVKKAKRMRWPHGEEIATQYLILALADMRTCSRLRLPFSASKHITPAAAELLKGRELLPAIAETPRQLSLTAS